jgi:hypothetical protein
MQVHRCTYGTIVSKIPPVPYEAVLQNLGAYKSIFTPHPQQQGHRHCNTSSHLYMQQNGLSDSIQFTTRCDYNNHPLLRTSLYSGNARCLR